MPQSFVRWYRESVRPVLAGDPAAAAMLATLEPSQSRGEPDLALPVYVVGNAGVGKSSLINALLSDRLTILPPAGLGPFTAAAARVVYDAEPYFRITCRGPDAVLEVVRALRGGGSDHDVAEALKRARLMVEGSQYGSAPSDYLESVLEPVAMGRLPGTCRDQDRGRLSVLAELMASPKRVVYREPSDDLPAFLMDLQLHGAGFLAPLTGDVEIGWFADFLAPGIQLVDLPGVGIANDSYRAASLSRMEGARAALLVVNRAGLSRDTAELLRPLFHRLLRGDRDACLVTAVTQIDMVANDSWATHDDEAASWIDHFDRTATAMLSLIRSQLREELARLALDLPSALPVDEVVARIAIRPVAPIEHRKLFRRSPRDPARIERSEDSRVDALRALLAEIGRAHLERTSLRLRACLRAAASTHPRGSSQVDALEQILYALETTTGE